MLKFDRVFRNLSIEALRIFILFFNTTFDRVFWNLAVEALRILIL